MLHKKTIPLHLCFQRPRGTDIAQEDNHLICIYVWKDRNCWYTNLTLLLSTTDLLSYQSDKDNSFHCF